MSNSELLACPLDWRVPDEDELGHEEDVLTALGIGGSYDIGEQSDGYILWWAADPFTFQDGFATIDDAKAAAEADWQKSIAAALTHPQLDELRAENARDRRTVAAVLRAVDNRSVPTMDSVWSAGWNSAMDFVSKAIIEARKALGATGHE